MNILKIAAVAVALVFSVPAVASDWSIPPGPEYDESYPDWKAAKSDFKSYKSGTLKDWISGVLGWKNDRIKDTKASDKAAKKANKAGELSDEELAAIREANKAKRTALREAKREAKAAKKEARQAAKQEARDRVEE